MGKLEYDQIRCGVFKKFTPKWIASQSPHVHEEFYFSYTTATTALLIKERRIRLHKFIVLSLHNSPCNRSVPVTEKTEILLQHFYMFSTFVTAHVTGDSF